MDQTGIDKINALSTEVNEDCIALSGFLHLLESNN